MSMLPVGIGGRRRGYEIEKSIRLSNSASANLTRTFSTPTSQNIYTLNVRCKRGQLGAARYLFGASTNYNFGFNASDQILLTIAGTAYTSTAVFRDPSSWYDITYSNTGTTYRVEVNGVVVLSGTSVSNTVFNSAVAHQLGSANSANYFDGYVADIRFIDGQYLDASSFGKTDPVTGQWIPKAYIGLYGTNGFYLPFTDGTSLTTLGYDESGNNNDWTLNNFSLTAGVTYDWMDDTPNNNFAVLNPISAQAGTIANANLSWQANVAVGSGSTVPMAGKTYFEFVVNGNNWRLGFTNNPNTRAEADVASATCRFWGDGQVLSTNVTVDSDTFTGSANGDVFGVAFDANALTCEIYKNNVLVVEFSDITISGPYFVMGDRFTGTSGTGQVHHINFGQRPFAYTPPAGFLALCTANLTSTDVIESGSFTGNANADGPFVWCNGTPETLTINSNAVTWGTHADRLANGFKLRTSSASYNAAGTNNWTATVLSPESKSAFKNQRAKGNP